MTDHAATPDTPPMTRREALAHLVQQGGDAFLSPTLAQEIADAFNLGTLTMDERPTLRGLPTKGFIAGELAVLIADTMGTPDGQRTYDQFPQFHYNGRGVAACTFIGAELVKAGEITLATDDTADAEGAE